MNDRELPVNNKDYSQPIIKIFLSYFRPHWKLFALDLSCASDAEEKLNALFAAMDGDIQDGAYADIRRVRANTKTFSAVIMA